MLKRLFAGASLIALWSVSAHAQTPAAGGPGVVPPNQASPAQASAASASGNAPTTLTEVVVTATKVSTNLQKTPLTVNSIDGATLQRAGVSNPQELNKLVPGLQIEQNGSGSSIFIRGVGSRVLNPTQDPAVAFDVDGVYYSRTTGPASTLFDLQRVEVVKGPQGTLYGRNATGGAVNIITNRPNFKGFSGDAEVEVGDYDTVRTTDSVNLPISSNLALRLAGQIVEHDGYLSDGYNDEDTKSVRASLLWKPAPRLSVYLSGDYSHQGGQGATPVPIGPGGNNNALTTRFVVPGDPFTGPSDPRVNAVVHGAAPATAIPVPIPGLYCAGTPFSLGGPVPANPTGQPAIPLCTYPLGVADIKNNGFLDNDYFGSNLTVEADLGFADLTAIGGYRGTRVDTLFSVDPTFQLQKVSADQGSVEMRLNSKPDSGPLTWLIGGFYLREDQSSSADVSTDNMAVPNPVAAPGSPLPASTCVGPLQAGGPGSPAIPGLCLASATVVESGFLATAPDAVDQSYAFFGQATYALTSRFRLTAGIRYTEESKTQKDGSITTFYTLPAGVTTSYPSVGAVSFTNTSYRAGVEYDVAPRSMIYASYSTGFHAGGFNQGVAQGPNPYLFAPETVTNYAVGIKNRFFNNTLQFNVEGFWLDYDNYQVQSLGRVNDGSVGCSMLDIVAACPYTLRTDNAATARVRGVEGDVIWRVLPGGTLFVNAIYNDATFTSFKQTNPLTGVVADYSGLTLPGASRVTVTAGYSQDFQLPNGALLTANVNTQYKNGTWMWYIHVPGNYQKAYSRTDLSLTYQPPIAGWRLTGYVRNVEGEATLLQGSPPEGVTGLPFNNLNPPRTYGGILSYHF